MEPKQREELLEYIGSLEDHDLGIYAKCAALGASVCETVTRLSELIELDRGRAAETTSGASSPGSEEVGK